VSGSKWRYLIGCPVIGYRSSCRDGRNESHPVAVEPEAE